MSRRSICSSLRCRDAAMFSWVRVAYSVLLNVAAFSVPLDPIYDRLELLVPFNCFTYLWFKGRLQNIFWPILKDDLCWQFLEPPCFPILQTSPITAQIDLFICNKGEKQGQLSSASTWNIFLLISCEQVKCHPGLLTPNHLRYVQAIGDCLYRGTQPGEKNARRQTVVTLSYTTDVITSSRLAIGGNKDWRREGKGQRMVGR